ncbi:MAG: RNA polymerase sigma factor [Terriglobales bacterium]
MDTGQFERALAEHQRMVFSIALHTLRDRALAEEITQDVFVALLEHGGEMASREHLLHWLRRVTSRRCIDQLRRQHWRRWLALSDYEATADTAAAPRGDPMLAARLAPLLRALPASERVALVLRYQEDLDPGEIGRLLGLPEKTVKNKLRHALAQLKLRLEHPAPAEGARVHLEQP